MTLTNTACQSFRCVYDWSGVRRSGNASVDKAALPMIDNQHLSYCGVCSRAHFESSNTAGASFLSEI